MNGNRIARGFSLLEALAAVALLAAALPPVLAIFADVMSRTGRADDRMQVLRRAQDLATLTPARFPGTRHAQSGSDADGTWSVEADPLERQDTGRRNPSTAVPVRLTVLVRSTRGAETRLESMFLAQATRR